MIPTEIDVAKLTAWDTNMNLQYDMCTNTK